MTGSRLSAAGALCFLLAGCDKSPVPPEPATLPVAPVAAAAPPTPGTCSHAATVETVLRLIRENIGSGPLLGDAESKRVALQALTDGTAPLSLTAVRTVAREDHLSRSQCEAILRIALPPGAFEKFAQDPISAAFIVTAGWQRDGTEDTASTSILYGSQLTDDRQSVVVEPHAAQDVAHAAGYMALAAWVVKMKGAQQAQAQPLVSLAAQAVDRAGGVCQGLDLAVAEGLLECGERQFKVADDKLNAIYKETMGQLPAARAAALRAEQRAWLAGLQSGCEKQLDPDVAGGSAGRLNLQGCITTRTEERANQIAAFR